MLSETSTPTASTGAATIPSPALEDDIIHVITGVTLVDADAKVIARSLQNKSWAQRAQYFNNIICHSIGRQAAMLKYARSEDDGVAFLKWG